MKPDLSKHPQHNCRSQGPKTEQKEKRKKKKTALVPEPQLASCCTGAKTASGEGVSLLLPPGSQATAPRGCRGLGEGVVLGAGCVDAGIGGFEGSCLSPRCLQQACPCLRSRQTG